MRHIFNAIFIPCFSGFMLFRVQVFQCPGFWGSGFRVPVQVLEVARLNIKKFLYLIYVISWNIKVLKEVSDKTLSIFWKRAYKKNWDFLKWRNWKKFFFVLFSTACIFDFCKTMNLRLYISFLVDKSMAYISMIYVNNEFY